MEDNKTKLSIVAGQPGVGKSTRLIEDGVNAILDGKTIFVMTPTHTAKNNLKSAIKYQWSISLSQTRKNALNKLQKSIHVLYGYQHQQVILIDEISMVSVPVLFQLFYRTERIKGAEIIGYGDAKQLPVIQGNSMIEELLRANIEGNVWDWVKDAYENVDFDELDAPASWHLEYPVSFEVMLENHRLSMDGYSGYNKQYIQDCVKDTFYKEDNNYSDVLVNAVNDNRLMITPTHKRGQEINDTLSAYFGENDWKIHAPFVKNPDETKVFLNPSHYDLEELKKAFKFLDVLPDSKDAKKYKPTAYIVVNVAQGATVKNALYYMGNTGLPSGNNKHHYSYNNFYTAITRSRKRAQLVGDKKSFEAMLEIVPVSAQARLGHFKAEAVMPVLFDNLRARNNTILSDEEVYDLYLQKFNETADDSIDNAQELVDYNVDSEPYTFNEMKLHFKEWDVIAGFVGHNYYDIYERYSKEVKVNNGAKKAGKGKVQRWLNELSEDEIESVKRDVNELSRSQFKAKYSKTNTSVKKALSEQTA